MSTPRFGLFADLQAADEARERELGPLSPPVPRVWEVREVNRSARRLLEETLPRLWVVGEVADYRRQRSGHCYFTLRDGSAQLPCVIFRRDAERLPADPEEGMRVRAFGGLTLYEARGAYQLVASRVEGEERDGMWKLAFDRLLARLEAEGLTDPVRKRPLPAFPSTVGVATSPTGAALRDIVSVAARRAPWLRLVVSPTSVQGRRTAPEIAAAIKALGERGVDVVLVARGGGSIEDLWGFNEEEVARAVAFSPVPVVSGVGHETDVTICDLVADVRAATPTAAAEAVTPDRNWLEGRLGELGRRLGGGLETSVRSWSARLDAAGQRMAHSARARAKDEASRLRTAASALETLSPLATLARGYALPLAPDGRLLRSADDFPAGQAFTLRLADGSVPAVAVAPSPPEDAPGAA